MKKVPVYKQFFLNTLGIRPLTPQNWAKQNISSWRKEEQEQNEEKKGRNYRVKEFRAQNEFFNNSLQNYLKNHVIT